ncbi:hypothetical protein [Brevibacterium sp. RIT 803]|nr:hypothetical protein [Brevibacterium sp. RIT 803]
MGGSAVRGPIEDGRALYCALTGAFGPNGWSVLVDSSAGFEQN